MSKITLDRGSFTKKLDEEIKQQMKLGARAFFMAAITNIPVQTGFARGSMNNLANAVGASETSGSGSRAKRYLSLSRKLKRTKFTGSGLEYYRFGGRRVVKTPQSGRMFSTKAENIFQSENGRYVFNFKVSISYFNLNDLFVHNPNSPWNAFTSGQAAFENYMRTTALRNLPKVTDCLVKSKVAISG